MFYFAFWVCYVLTFCMWQEREQEIREFFNQPANKISRFDFLVSLVELMLSGQAMDGAGWHEGALCMAVGQSALVCPCPYCIYLNKGCFGHWALRTGKLLFGIHSSKSLQWVSYAQTLYCQWPITKATFNESGIYCNGCRPFCGEVSKKFFRPLWGWGRALPLDPPLYYRTVPSALVLLYWLSLVSTSNSFP